MNNDAVQSLFLVDSSSFDFLESIMNWTIKFQHTTFRRTLPNYRYNNR